MNEKYYEFEKYDSYDISLTKTKSVKNGNKSCYTSKHIRIQQSKIKK